VASATIANRTGPAAESAADEAAAGDAVPAVVGPVEVVVAVAGALGAAAAAVAVAGAVAVGRATVVVAGAVAADGVLVAALAQAAPTIRRAALARMTRRPRAGRRDGFWARTCIV
jgi:hypothetical protein